MKNIKVTDFIKIAALLLLLICIVLPFQSCTQEVDENGVSIILSKKPAVGTVTKYTYTWERFGFKDTNDWLFLLCFIWPIPIVIHRYMGRKERLKILFWLLEPLCIGGASSYTHFLSTFLTTPAIGAYLIQTAYFFYGISWASEAVIKIIKKGKAFGMLH